MTNKIMLLMMSAFLTIATTTSPIIDLSTMLPSCCCQTDCNCKHDLPNEAVIRNIQCGDNTSNAIAVFSYDSLIMPHNITITSIIIQNTLHRLTNNPFDSVVSKPLLQPPQTIS